MKSLGKLCVILATSLAGARLNTPIITSCSGSPECQDADRRLDAFTSILPWLVVSVGFLFLSIPSILCPFKNKLSGLRLICWFYLKLLVLACVCLSLKHRILLYIVGLHGAVYYLLNLEEECSMKGGRYWWALRFLIVEGLLFYAGYYGPGVSVVSWHKDLDVICGIKAHLLGAILPEVIETVTVYCWRILEILFIMELRE